MKIEQQPQRGGHIRLLDKLHMLAEELPWAKVMVGTIVFFAGLDALLVRLERETPPVAIVAFNQGDYVDLWNSGSEEVDLSGSTILDEQDYWLAGMLAPGQTQRFWTMAGLGLDCGYVEDNTGSDLAILLDAHGSEVSRFSADN
jgi:hypothetical protein